MKTFNCDSCGSVVFFENVVCGNCGSALGFVPEAMKMTAFKITDDGQWQSLYSSASNAGPWRPCVNYQSYNVCNWMVPAADENDLCACCRYTEIIPALKDVEHKQSWYLLEAAKRRLFYSLYSLQLPIPSRQEDPDHGLVFHLKEDEGIDKPVLTGHDFGLITINIAEADDVTREARRKSMHEPYRTLLGHFRHEIGHFYWDQLIAESHWLEPYRELFGDERLDYGEALEKHYNEGAPENWEESFVSSYATTHPWEDWAETWAHYMHITDALDTANHWQSNNAYTLFAYPVQKASQAVDFQEVLVNCWMPLSQFLNSMNRSLGQKDSYPFLMPDAVINKLRFIDQVIREQK
jgi:hypothetical protein